MNTVFSSILACDLSKIHTTITLFFIYLPLFSYFIPKSSLRLLWHW